MTDLSAGVVFREMSPTDVGEALDLIAYYDEEEAQEAQGTFSGDLAGYFVLQHDGGVIGVTGATPIDGTSGAYVLGWTAIHHSRPSDDLRGMLGQLSELLREFGGRKLFAHVSDYIDPEMGDVSAPLRRALADLGYQEELRHANYYDINETLIIYGMRLQPALFQQHAADERGIKLTDIDEIEETEGSFWLSWELVEGTPVLRREDFQMIIDQVNQWNGRSIYISFPTGVASVDTMMQTAGFRFDGRLSDFYDDGVDDLRYRYDLR